MELSQGIIYLAWIFSFSRASVTSCLSAFWIQTLRLSQGVWPIDKPAASLISLETCLKPWCGALHLYLIMCPRHHNLSLMGEILLQQLAFVAIEVKVSGVV
jgi:hypothetical protein